MSWLKGFFFKIIYLFIYLWLCWVFISVRGLSLAAASGGHSSSQCAGLSLSRPLLLRSTGSRRAGSANVAHGPSRSAACGIFPDQGSNPCPLHWQVGSQPLRHQGSPRVFFNGKNWNKGICDAFKKMYGLEKLSWFLGWDCKSSWLGWTLQATKGEGIRNKSRASLVAQWLRICLPMQGTQVRALVREDSTWGRAAKPVRHNSWATECAL